MMGIAAASPNGQNVLPNMIFGFNTDIKHEDTVYHVQSEARENELTLQTQVFVRGRCIGKRAVSYSEKLSQGGFNDQNKEQMLRDQHRLVLDAIRDGKLDTVMKLMISGVTLSAASVKSPSFSRSSSSTITTIRPARNSSIAVGTSVNGLVGDICVARLAGC